MDMKSKLREYREVEATTVRRRRSKSDRKTACDRQADRLGKNGSAL